MDILPVSFDFSVKTKRTPNDVNLGKVLTAFSLNDVQRAELQPVSHCLNLLSNAVVKTMTKSYLR